MKWAMPIKPTSENVSFRMMDDHSSIPSQLSWNLSRLGGEAQWELFSGP